jgi:mutator protein MutT
VAVQLNINNRLRDYIASNLQKFEVRGFDATRQKHAAIAVVITNCHWGAYLGDIPFDETMVNQAAIILTTRASNLTHHAGQRAFPGGRIDDGESPEQAALRELHEEIGVKLSGRNILGRLDDYATRSGFVITPIVVWGGPNLALKANPDEVETIHHIPVSELLRNDAPILESIPESEHPVLKMPIGNDWFAAPTAAIAYQFREVGILGKQTRVAHFDQPYFAWK